MNNISTLYNYLLTSTTIFNSADTVFIKSFSTGEKDDVAVSGADLYPRVFLEQPFMVYTDGPVTTFDLMLVVMDKYDVDDPVDLRHKQDLTYEILQHLIEKFKRDKIYQVDQNYVFSSYIAYNDDITAAWRVEIKFIEVIPVNRCENKNVFGNCYSGYAQIDVGYEATSSFRSITINGNEILCTEFLYLDNVIAIKTYLDSLISMGTWSVYYDVDNNLHLDLKHSTSVPTGFSYNASAYGGPAYSSFERTSCTLD
jgi:hypothetical protein